MKHKHGLKEGMTVFNVTKDERTAIRHVALLFGFEVQSGPNYRTGGYQPHIRVGKGEKGMRLSDFTEDDMDAVAGLGGIEPVTATELICAMVTPPKEEPETEPESAWDKMLFERIKKTAGEEKATALWNKLKRIGAELDAEEELDTEDVLNVEDMSVKIDMEDRSHLSPVQRINALESEVESLKQKLAEAEKKVAGEEKPVEEDSRVDFGERVTFGILPSNSPFNRSAFIGENLADYEDRNKVLIPSKGYTFKLRENYYDGRPALEIHRI